MRYLLDMASQDILLGADELRARRTRLHWVRILQPLPQLANTRQFSALCVATPTYAHYNVNGANR